MRKYLNNDTYLVGVNDYKTTIFEHYIPIEKGVSYNSYLIIDEKTCLLDTVLVDYKEEFIENIKVTLNGRDLDYLVVQHMEPDHSSAIFDIISNFPNVKIVTSALALKMIKQFFAGFNNETIIIKENDCLSLGKHELVFISAPFVHWPEVMITYDKYSKYLFSADAFGGFNALKDNIYFDDALDKEEYLEEARRYYTNIVGKYGDFVLKLLNKAKNLDISLVCPLHGYLFNDVTPLLNDYIKYASYEAMKDGALIIYGTMYGNTKEAALFLNDYLVKNGVETKIYDVSLTDKTFIVSDSFVYKNIVFITPTYNLGIYPKIEEILIALRNANMSKKQVYLIENGSWSPLANKIVKNILADFKFLCFYDEEVTIRSKMTEKNKEEIISLADNIIKLNK